MRSTNPRPRVGDADLTAERRLRDWAALAQPVDVLVVGGGVTGCGVALDAATRGLTVALVESEDLAFGTSRWSSKLIHGGLRYLAHGQVDVAWESAQERRHLMATIAPHLVRPLAHAMPAFTDTPVTDRLLVRAGLAAADALRIAARTPRGVLGRPRSLNADGIAALVPGIDRERLIGGTVHWDGQVVDDARLVVALARTAAAHGARILTHARASDVDGSGARVTDVLTGDMIDVAARTVIVAAGVWTPTVDPATHLRASRGSHVLLRPEALGHPIAALTVAVPGERGRYVFALPSPDGPGRPVLAGLTDVDVPDPIPDVPRAPADEVAWIMRHLSTALARPLGPDDVMGTFAGLRPLVADPGVSTSSADISRRHLVERRTNGIVVVTGGKLTTYRRMAADAVDLAAPDAGPCRTTEVPLVGAQARRTPPVPGVPPRLVRHYGAEAARVATWAESDPGLLEPVAPGCDVLGVEIVHAVRAEGACTLADVVERRTRLGLVPAEAEAAAERVRDIAVTAGLAEAG